MSKETTASGGSIGFGGFLTLLFIGLKLTHVIAWSWIWVLSPIWLTLAFVTGIFVVAVIGIFIQSILQGRKKK